MKHTTIIFDLGGVFIDWNPRHFYKNVFSNNEEMEEFLDTVCTNDWNENQDAGKDIHEATNELVQQFPDKKKLIQMYYNNWEQMLNGYDEKMVELLKNLKEKKQVKLFALTNWSQFFFPRAKQLFGFLNLFEGIVVSGEEKMKKPSFEIYTLTLNRYNLQSDECIFIDDNLRNVKAADNLGIHAIHFQNHSDLVERLKKLEISC